MAIERYCSLRYGPNSKSKNNEKLASEDIFNESLKSHVPENKIRIVYRTDTLKKLTLDCYNPKESIDYYYIIRCNIAHRGKEPVNDGDIVCNSLDDLFKIFNDILNYTFK